jgi:hypothetical protein
MYLGEIYHLRLKWVLSVVQGFLWCDRARVSILLDSPTDTPYLSSNNLEYHCSKPSLRLGNPCLSYIVSCAFSWTRELDPGFEGSQQLDCGRTTPIDFQCLERPGFREPSCPCRLANDSIEMWSRGDSTPIRSTQRCYICCGSEKDRASPTRPAELSNPSDTPLD